ncbi:uncharacterized protein METZ01_LOCUS133531 [marine metagenome]|uniref:Uncharacterized protein n=1 Tax=marine metagenome TaxID=408172 RepID=A0A381YW20_9ZZZZ
MKTDSLLELAENTNPKLIIMSNIFFM